MNRQEITTRWSIAHTAFYKTRDAVVRCPKNDDDVLKAYDIPSPPNPAGGPPIIDRLMVCSKCGARNVVRVKGSRWTYGTPIDFFADLHWNEVAPSRRSALDSEVVAAVRTTIESAATEFIQTVSPSKRAAEVNATRWDVVDLQELDAFVDRSLISGFGAWITGWHWLGDEGGPINVLNFNNPRPQSASEYATFLLEGIVEYQALLVELEAAFKPVSTTSQLDVEIEEAAARLLPIMTSRNTSGSWYHDYATVLCWYVEATRGESTLSEGGPSVSMRKVIRDAVRGTFTSWVEEPTRSIEVFHRELSDGVLSEEEKNESAYRTRDDSLKEWQKIRESAFTNPYNRPLFKKHQKLERDGHQRFIEEFDRKRGEARADAMQVALDACRASAQSGAALTFEELAKWQAIVLGGTATFRRGDAYAKKGRERYPLTNSTKSDFERALSQASGDQPLSIRAARVYLDVCFFHPFEDGNARAARLALDHTLMREGHGIHTGAALFNLSRSAADARGAADFARALDFLIGKID